MQHAAPVMQFLNANTGAITGLATVALLLVTGWYAWTTRALLKEAQQTRLMASEPRVVAYLRVHEIHGNIVQLCIANLSAAAATGVSASVDKVTDWPTKFSFGDIKILRDLSFLRPHEVLRFDLGHGPDLFRDGKPAMFKAAIKYESLDGRSFAFEETLKIESVAGFGNWRVYGIDDVARRLEEISKTLSGFSGGRRLNVDSFSAADRKEEELVQKEWRGQNPPGRRE